MGRGGLGRGGFSPDSGDLLASTLHGVTTVEGTLVGEVVELGHVVAPGRLRAICRH